MPKRMMGYHKMRNSKVSDQPKKKFHVCAVLSVIKLGLTDSVPFSLRCLTQPMECHGLAVPGGTKSTRKTGVLEKCCVPAIRLDLLFCN